MASVFLLVFDNKLNFSSSGFRWGPKYFSLVYLNNYEEVSVLGLKSHIADCDSRVKWN